MTVCLLFLTTWQAEDSVKQAERCDPSSPYTFFFHFKTALAKKDNAAGKFINKNMIFFYLNVLNSNNL